MSRCSGQRRGPWWPAGGPSERGARSPTARAATKEPAKLDRLIPITCPSCGTTRAEVTFATLVDVLGIPESTKIDQIGDLCAKCDPALQQTTKARRSAKSAEYRKQRRERMTEEQKATDREKRREYQKRRNAKIKEALEALKAQEEGRPAEAE